MADSFVEKFVTFTEDSETPRSFWKWGAYAIVAAVLRDNVYWNQRGKKICPNIYVLLNADSATDRKSNPVDAADRLLTVVKNTKVIRGRGSIQAILEHLSSGGMDKETGKLLKGGSCLLVADELKSFFVEDAALVGIMTDVYEYKETFDYKLRGAGFRIKGLCLSMLAASNDEFLKSIYTGEAIYGGLLGRTFLIKSDGFKPGNSLLEVEGQEEANRIKYDETPYVDMLKDMAKLEGRVRFEPEAKVTYDNWYLPLRESYRLKPDKTGVIARLHTGVVKLAVVLAVSRRLELIVRKVDIEDAIYECMSLLPNYEGFAIRGGKSPEALAGEHILAELKLNNGQITRSEFMAKHWYDVSSEMLDKILVSLQETGWIQMSYGMSASSATIVMTDKCRKTLKMADLEKIKPASEEIQ